MEMISGHPDTGFVLARIRHTGAVTFFRFLPMNTGDVNGENGEMVRIQRRVYNTSKVLLTETEIVVNQENVFDRIAHY